jgi:glycosyltransferase involved in cell wall biosynthesis
MNKTLEYMAFAKPQVMFGTREGMHSAGASALCVMENSSAKLGDAILELLDDPARREQMGQLGHARLTQELNWQCSVEQLLAAYERA